MEHAPGAADELAAALRLLRARAIRGGHPRRVRFADEPPGGVLSEVQDLHEDVFSYREALEFAGAQAMDMFRQNVAPILEECLSRFVGIQDEEEWLRAASDLKDEIDQDTMVTLVACCENCVSSLAVEAAGYVLASVGNERPEHLVSVVESGGVMLISRALAMDTNAGLGNVARRVRDVSLEVISKAVDPNGDHCGSVRERVAAVASSDGDKLISGLLAELDHESGNAVTALAGIVRAAPELRNGLRVEALEPLLAGMNATSDAKRCGQLLDVLVGLASEASAERIFLAALEALGTFPKNVKVQVSGLACLQACLLRRACTAESACQGFEAVLHAMRLLKGVPAAQRMGLKALRGLASAALSPETAREAADVVSTAAQKCHKMPEALNDASEVLSAIASKSGRHEDAVRDARSALPGAPQATAQASSAEPPPRNAGEERAEAEGEGRAAGQEAAGAPDGRAGAPPPAELSSEELAKLSKEERKAYHQGRRAARSAGEAERPPAAQLTRAQRRAVQEAQRRAKEDTKSASADSEELLKELRMQGLSEEQARSVMAEMHRGGAAADAAEDEDEDAEPQDLPGSVWRWMREQKDEEITEESIRDFNMKVRFQGHVDSTPPDHLRCILGAVVREACAGCDLAASRLQPGAVAQRVRPGVERWAPLLEVLFGKVNDALEGADAVIQGVEAGISACQAGVPPAGLACGLVGSLMAIREIDVIDDEDLRGPAGRVPTCIEQGEGDGEVHRVPRGGAGRRPGRRLTRARGSRRVASLRSPGAPPQAPARDGAPTRLLGSLAGEQAPLGVAARRPAG
ncbi:unnamed protein product [Prorocentrum cordatum]|uniref:TOG domain-containing protein n=1 Tax=Prorocentrum cordatum TaxID=2364126 RepID=A0ABN9UQZ4_9DINO|nr:unnamed protein product [Polarella glacialis]